MLIIFEGCDNVGKDTQIKLLQKYMFAKHNLLFHQWHYSGFSSDLPSFEQKKLNERLYEEMLGYLNIIYSVGYGYAPNIILNRSHIGEFVYGDIYRHYDASYMFALEECYPSVINDMKLIMLLDSPENLIKRDDGESFSTELENKKKEIALFKEAFELTNIQKKILIEKNSIENIHNKIINFVES